MLGQAPVQARNLQKALMPNPVAWPLLNPTERHKERERDRQSEIERLREMEKSVEHPRHRIG